MDSPPRPRVGISACLLGQRVRYDGRDKRDPLLVEALGPLVEWVPVCPELELGLGVPREPIRLVGRVAAPRLVGERSGRDHTAAMRAYAEHRVATLAALGLDGWVTKGRSPSCGLRAVPVHAPGGGTPTRRGVGAFARILRARLPDLPIEEEGRLHDAAALVRFLERARAHRRRREAVGGGGGRRRGAGRGGGARRPRALV